MGIDLNGPTCNIIGQKLGLTETEFFCFKESNNRFVSVGKKENNNGEMPKFVILQRTRREHYNLVYAQSDRTTGKNIQFHNIAYLWSCRVIQA